MLPIYIRGILGGMIIGLFLMGFLSFLLTRTLTIKNPIINSSLPNPIKIYVMQKARAVQVDYYGVPLTEEILDKIISCESQWNPIKEGDYVNSKPNSFGLWQIFLPHHPQITKEQALDPYISTDYAFKLITGDCKNCRKGLQNFTCFRMNFSYNER